MKPLILSAALRGGLFFVASFWLMASAQAQGPQAPLTLVHGGAVTVTSTDLEADALMRMPPEMRPMVLSDAKSVEQVASNMYVRRVMARQAEADGLAKDPQVAAQLQLARDKVLSDAILARIDAQSAPAADVALAQARDMYRDNPDKFKVGDEVRARHILIAGDTPEAKAEAEKLLTELKGGADFAKLAQAHSADKGSAAKGGDLGLFGKGRMVPEFEHAAFALKNKGDLSDVVKTQYGYHIIQLEERVPAHVRPFDEVKDELVKQVRATIQQNARVAEAQKLAAELKTDPDAIKAFAAEWAKQVPADKKAPVASK